MIIKEDNKIMKFSEMLYTRPDVQELRTQLAALTKRLKEAGDYAAAKEVFLAKEKLGITV